MPESGNPPPKALPTVMMWVPRHLWSTPKLRRLRPSPVIISSARATHPDRGPSRATAGRLLGRNDVARSTPAWARQSRCDGSRAAHVNLFARSSTQARGRRDSGSLKRTASSPHRGRSASPAAWALSFSLKRRSHERQHAHGLAVKAAQKLTNSMFAGVALGQAQGALHCLGAAGIELQPCSLGDGVRVDRRSHSSTRAWLVSAPTDARATCSCNALT